jgi:hypothetical protein
MNSPTLITYVRSVDIFAYLSPLSSHLAEKIFSIGNPTTTSYSWSVYFFPLSAAISKLISKLSPIFTRFYNFFTSFGEFSDVTVRKWRHLSMEWPRFPNSVRQKFRVCCVPFTSYMRFSLVSNGDLSISTANGRLEPQVTSPFDSSTTVSFKCSIHTTCLARTIRQLYPFFRLSIMAESRFRPLGGVGDRK